MKRGQSPSDRRTGQLTQALAAIISNTRSKTRSLSLTAVHHWLEIAVAKLGSIRAVAQRVSLSPKMLGQFASVGRLTTPVQTLFSKRAIDSVDAATHLAMLSAKDQEVVARALVGGDIDTSDVRGIVQLRKEGSTASILPLLNRVRSSKTKQEYVAEFVIRGAHTRDELLAAFMMHIPSSEIVRLEIQGAVGRLVLTKQGRNALVRAGHKLGTPMKHTIPTLLESQLKK